MTKYGNRHTVIDDIHFDSQREAWEYLHLKSRLEAGEISDLRLQPKYQLLPTFTHMGERVRATTYTPDFDFIEAGRRVVLEVKGGKATQTEAYRLRAKLFKFTYPDIELRVTE